MKEALQHYSKDAVVLFVKGNGDGKVTLLKELYFY